MFDKRVEHVGVYEDEFPVMLERESGMFGKWRIYVVSKGNSRRVIVHGFNFYGRPDSFSSRSDALRTVAAMGVIHDRNFDTSYLEAWR